MAKNNDEMTLEERQLRLQERQQEFQERQLQIQEAALGVQKKQLTQTAPKSLQMAPKISPFNLRGQKDYPNPRLKCEVYAPWKIDPNLEMEAPSLDREEIELFNLLEPGNYTIERTDGVTVPCCVIGVKSDLDGTLERLSLMGPKDGDTGHYRALFDRENKMLFPALKILLRQLLEQQGCEAVADVVPMKREARVIADGAAIEKAGGENPYPVSVGA